MIVQSRRRIILGAGAAMLTSRAFAQTAALNFLVVGDWGQDSDAQRSVARSMGEVAAGTQSRFVISTGDNFYPRGVESVTDPQFAESFEDIYSASSLQTPWYVVLGNHDYEGSPNAEIAYSSRSARWRMPARYWSEKMEIAGARVSFYFLDTTPIARLSNAAAHVPLLGSSDEARAQLDWLEQALSTDRSEWKIVVGHHPILSSGNHGEAPALAERVKPLLQRYGVQAYFNGHDHDLEHLTENGVHYICSGSGALSRQVFPVDQSRFAYADLGFVSCGLTPGAMEMRFHGEDGAVIYSASVNRA